MNASAVLEQDIERSYTIAGHAKYGLPTAKDEDIYLGLLKQTLDYNQFKTPRIYFSRSELFDILGWRKKDWAYDRLLLGLHRLSGVRIHCKNAWRDNRNKEWCDREDFGILDSFRLRDMRRAESNQPFEGYSSMFVWGAVLFESFDAGYLKKLDLSVLRQLKSYAAKRLYRFLDKRFYPPKRTVIELPVPVLAYERIGVSRKTPIDKVIKRYLRPAIEELETAGFLAASSAKDPFTKLRGEWRVELAMRPQQKSNQPKSDDTSRLVRSLVKRGLSESSASRYVHRYDKARVVDAAKAHDEQIQSGIKVENVERWFAKALRDGFKPNSDVARSRSKRPECQIFRPSWDLTNAKTSSTVS